MSWRQDLSGPSIPALFSSHTHTTPSEDDWEFPNLVVLNLVVFRARHNPEPRSEV